MDFGLARDIRSEIESTATMPSAAAGTPSYMSREQLRGNPAANTFDIHALGAIMFEMVTKRLPFEGDTPFAIAAARLNGEAPSPRRYASGLDPRWERTILACLDSDPEKRPKTAAAVLEMLGTPVPGKWPRRAFIGVTAGALATATGVELFRILRPVHRNHDAEAAFARGQVFSRRQTGEGFDNAILEFSRATQLEPGWAEAWSDLADAWAGSSNATSANPAAAIVEARKAARTAIRLDDRLARAHGSLGWTLALDFDLWPSAEAEFRRAIKLDGRDAEVRRWYAAYLRKLGRFREAEAQINAGLEFTQATDPRLLFELAFLYFTARQNDRFMAHVIDVRKLFPNDSTIESMYAKSLEMQGKYVEALDALNYSARLGMNATAVMALKAGLAISRNRLAEARALAAEVEQRYRKKPVEGLVLAGVYARLGDADRAFDVLEQAYRAKDNTLLSLATYPWIDPLRSDRRFESLLDRLHFTSQIMQRMEFKPASVSAVSRQPRRTGKS
jgi:Flp pilus assembly protein TadD